MESKFTIIVLYIYIFFIDGSTFKLKGCILSMSFLDCNGALIPYSYESWKDDSMDSKERNSMLSRLFIILLSHFVSINLCCKNFTFLYYICKRKFQEFA